MPGLNDDFPLEEENVVKISPTQTVIDEKASEEDPSHMLYVDEDLTEYEETLNKISDALCLRESLESCKGMSQDMALSMESVFPGFINDQRPIGYFTKHVSKTQYTPSLESLKDNISDLFKKLMEMISKMIEKFNEFINSVAERFKKDIDKSPIYDSEYQSKASKLLKRISDISKSTDKEINSLKTKTKSAFKDVDADDFFTKLEERFAALNNQIDSLYESINSKRLIKAVILKPEIIKTYETIFDNRDSLIKGFEIINDYAIKIANGKSTIEYDSEEEADTEKRFLAHIKKLKVPSLNMIPSEALNHLRDELGSLDNQTLTKENLHLLDLKNKLDRVIDKDKLRKNMLNIDSIQDKINTIHKNIRSSINEEYRGTATEIKKAKKLMALLGSEMTPFFAIINNYIAVMHNQMDVNQKLKDIIYKYERDIYLSTVTMDKVFTEYIKEHFE